VTWLLVAFIPGLLMLATFGLDRLEASLDGDTVSPADVNAYLEQAKADCAKPAARPSEVQTYELLDDDYLYPEPVASKPPPGLPTPTFIRQGSNTEFQPTRHAYRV
jgi:hypothetical protein